MEKTKFKKGDHVVAVQDLDISNIESKLKRDRVRIERSKYDSLQFDLKMAQTALENRNKEIDGWVKQNNELRAERDRLQDMVDTLSDEVDYAHKANERALKKAEEFQQLYMKADERALNGAEKMAHLDTLARNLRDQRDTARFMAALFALCALGFAVAVWIGKLQPVVNVD